MDISVIVGWLELLTLSTTWKDSSKRECEMRAITQHSDPKLGNSIKQNNKRNLGYQLTKGKIVITCGPLNFLKGIQINAVQVITYLK